MRDWGNQLQTLENIPRDTLCWVPGSFPLQHISEQRAGHSYLGEMHRSASTVCLCCVLPSWAPSRVPREQACHRSCAISILGCSNQACVKEQGAGDNTVEGDFCNAAIRLNVSYQYSKILPCGRWPQEWVMTDVTSLKCFHFAPSCPDPVLASFVLAPISSKCRVSCKKGLVHTGKKQDKRMLPTPYN